MRIQIAKSQSDFFQIIRIRRDVFVIGQEVDPCIEQDELDDTAIHVIVHTDEGKPIATCRLLEKDDCYIVGRLAVLEEYRSTGVGSQILGFLETIPQVQAKGCIKLHAQFHAYDFYRKNGYTAVGEHFWEAGIEHVEMEKKLFEEEYKTLVTEKQLKKLAEIMHAPEPTKQVNHYYSSSTEGKFHSSIRVRERNDEVIFTLKVKSPQGLQEHEKYLVDSDFTKDAYVMAILQENDLQGPYTEWAQLTTYRSEIEIMDGDLVLAELCLDRNEYNGHVDFEVEYEVQHAHNAVEKFTQILAQADIPYVPNKTSKVKRCKQTL